MITIRVLLADDHALVRSGMRALIEGMHGITVAGEAENGREAVTLVEELRPDVVLLDISMPELNGLEAAARIRQARPETRILLLSMHADEQYVARAVGVGADGYLVKNADAGELERAIRAAARGITYLSPAVADKVTSGRDSVERDPPLSPRQREILQLIAEGNSTRQIAVKLGLSVKTVETHRAHVMERLEIRDVAGLVRYAIRIGLITPDG